MRQDNDMGAQVHEHVGSLRRYALVLTRNPDSAEDLVQETLTKAIAAAHQWEPGTDLRVWLFRILHNTHISDMRKLQVRERAKPDLPEPVTTPDPTLRIEVQEVLDALDQLPSEQRQPIILIAVEGMSYAEAAEALNIPAGTLYSRLGRGRAALREMMDGKKRSKLRVVG
ncbi:MULTISPECIES: sigma-70 family RNA polymerase sigma factor [unclassified Roseobacter]|nr:MULTISPECIES: sigma-70 family RNA polymerase sigma factor [unclassified Roseobacter]